MSKKQLIKSLFTGVVFGLIIYGFIMVAVHFIDLESEDSIITEPLKIRLESIPIERHEGLNPSMEAIPIPIETPDADLTMVTFKYQSRVQTGEK